MSELSDLKVTVTVNGVRVITPMQTGTTSGEPGIARRIVDVDFNCISADGRVIVRNAPVIPLRLDELVCAKEDAEDMWFNGKVTGFSEDGRRAYLTMEWEPADA